MAKATVETTETKVTLEMTGEEAEVLLKMFNNIGGDPDRGPRGTIDPLRRALVHAGIKPNDDVNVREGMYLGKWSDCDR